MGCNSSKQTIYLIQDGKKVDVSKWASKDIQFEKSGTTSQSISQYNRTSNLTPNSNKDARSQSPSTSKKKNERSSGTNGATSSKGNKNSSNASNNRDRQQQILKYFNQATIRDRDFPFQDHQFNASFEGAGSPKGPGQQAQDKNLKLPQLHSNKLEDTQRRSSSKKKKSDAFMNLGDMRSSIDDRRGPNDTNNSSSFQGTPLAEKIRKSNLIAQTQGQDKVSKDGRRLDAGADKTLQLLENKNAFLSGKIKGNKISTKLITNHQRVISGHQNFNKEFSKLQGNTRQVTQQSNIPNIIEYSQRHPFQALQEKSGLGSLYSKKKSSQSNAFTLNAPQITQTNGSRSELNEYEYTFQAKPSPSRMQNAASISFNFNQKALHNNRFNELRNMDSSGRSQEKSKKHNQLSVINFKKKSNSKIFHTQNNSPSNSGHSIFFKRDSNNTVYTFKNKSQLEPPSNPYANNVESLRDFGSTDHRFKQHHSEQQVNRKKYKQSLFAGTLNSHEGRNRDQERAKPKVSAGCGFLNNTQDRRAHSNKSHLQSRTVVQPHTTSNLSKVVFINNNIKIIQKNRIHYQEEQSTPGRSLREAYNRSHQSQSPSKKQSTRVDILKKIFDDEKEESYIYSKYIRQKKKRPNAHQVQQSPQQETTALRESDMQLLYTNSMQLDNQVTTSVSNLNTQVSGAAGNQIEHQPSFLEKSSFEDNNNNNINQDSDSLASQIQNSFEPPIIIREEPVEHINIEDKVQAKRTSILISQRRVSSARESRRISKINSAALMNLDNTGKNISGNVLSIHGSQTSLQNIKEHASSYSNKRTSRSLSLNNKSDGHESENSEKFILPKINIIGLGGEKTEVDSSMTQSNNIHSQKKTNHLRVSTNSMNSQSYYKRLQQLYESQMDNQQSQNRSSLHPIQASSNFSDMKRELKLQMASMTIRQIKSQLKDRSFSEKHSPRELINSLSQIQQSLDLMSIQHKMQKSAQSSLLNKSMQQPFLNSSGGHRGNFVQVKSKFKKEQETQDMRVGMGRPQNLQIMSSQGNSSDQRNQFRIQITPHHDKEDQNMRMSFNQRQMKHESSNQVITLKISNEALNSVSQPKTFSFGSRGTQHDPMLESGVNGTIQSYTYNIPTIIHSSVMDSNAEFYSQQEALQSSYGDAVGYAQYGIRIGYHEEDKSPGNQEDLNQMEEEGYDTPKSKYSDGQKVDHITNMLKPMGTFGQHEEDNAFSSYAVIKQSHERGNFLRQSYQDIGSSNQDQLRASTANGSNLLKQSMVVKSSSNNLSPEGNLMLPQNILRQSMQSIKKKESEMFSPNFRIIVQDQHNSNNNISNSNNNLNLSTNNNNHKEHHFNYSLSESIQLPDGLLENNQTENNINAPTPSYLPPHIAKKMNNMYSSKNMHHSDMRLNIPGMAAIAQEGQAKEKNFVFDSILLLSNDQINNYTQYSGSRKGSNMMSNQSIRDSKQADFNSYNDEDGNDHNDGENILNLVTESEISQSEEEIYMPPSKEFFNNQFMDSSVRRVKESSGGAKTNVQGSSASVVYNVKNSSSDVLRNPSSQISGLVSVDRGTTSANRQVQFKNSDKTFSKYSSQNMMKFLNRIMQLDDEDEEDDELFDNNHHRTSSITPNPQNMQFLSSALDINGINKESNNRLSSMVMNPFQGVNQSNNNYAGGGIGSLNNSNPNNQLINNSAKKRSLNDGEHTSILVNQLAQDMKERQQAKQQALEKHKNTMKLQERQKEMHEKDKKRPKKSQKIKVVNSRRSINFVEYKFPQEEEQPQ